jgi:hypothetical protein
MPAWLNAMTPPHDIPEGKKWIAEPPRIKYDVIGHAHNTTGRPGTNQTRHCIDICCDLGSTTQCRFTVAFEQRRRRNCVRFKLRSGGADRNRKHGNCSKDCEDGDATYEFKESKPMLSALVVIASNW